MRFGAYKRKELLRMFDHKTALDGADQRGELRHVLLASSQDPLTSCVSAELELGRERSR
jgi:hypothetical protein